MSKKRCYVPDGLILHVVIRAKIPHSDLICLYKAVFAIFDCFFDVKSKGYNGLMLDIQYFP